jgi:putative ABC transport system ATP-binding protein
MSAGLEALAPVIELRGVSKDYPSGEGVVRALRELDLTIDRGELVAIVGTSGSGKSTLMNILGCLDRPTRGTYRLGGIDVGSRTGDARAILRNRLIGFIFQGFNLLSRTTALENVELPLVYRGVPRRKRRKLALEALEAVGLGERIHHTSSQLSGGQQQRVAIARALVTSPPLLLADEPTGNLDTRTSLEVLALLQSLNRERGITIALVTHEHDIAACASRVVTFRDGRMVSDVVQSAPMDAAKALADLPAPEASGTPLREEGELAGAHLGGPIPSRVYVTMTLFALAGAAVGAAYSAWVWGKASWVASLVGALAFESFGAANAARRVLGRGLTRDQRARVAVHATVGLVAVAGVFAAIAMPSFDAMAARVAASPWRSASAIALAAVGLVMARFLLLELQRARR